MERELPELPEGFRWASASAKDENGNPYFAASVKGTEVFRVEGEFFYPIPISAEVAGELDYRTGFTDENGEPFELTGPDGMVARYVYGKLESGRGELRKRAVDHVEITPEMVQEELFQAAIFNTGRRSRTISEADVEDAFNSGDLEAMKKLLQAKGVRLK